MTIHTGKLLKPQVYLTWKHRYDYGTPDQHFTAPAGALVEWDDGKENTSNAGYEGYYGGTHLYWIDLPEYGHGIGAELGVDFEWDDDVQ